MAGMLEQGIFFFNERRYFAAHEAWEELWTTDQSALRSFYQGLIQASVGLHHLSNSNTIGARAQLTKSLARLDPYPDHSAGIDLVQLRQDLRKVLDHMDLEDLPAIRIVLQSKGR